MKPLKVVFFHRKPRKFGSFSVEFIYNTVRENLPKDFTGIKSVASYESNGLWKRLYITIEAAFRQQWGEVNHITGDVHFLATFLKNEKTVLTILDVGFMKHPSKLARKILQIFWLIIPVKRVAAITTISQATKDELLQYVSCDPAKVRVVYVPISDAFKPVPRPFNKEKPVILQLGIAFNKNIERLIEAIKDIPCHLEVVGKLPEALQDKLKAYNISHQISWNLSDEEIRQKYADCDILTLISTYEGFGMPIVEANAVGRVAITSNILSMPEVAGDAAHLVNPLDVANMREGFLKIIHDDAYREQLIANGFKNRERFTVQKITEDYCAVYREITQQNKK